MSFLLKSKSSFTKRSKVKKKLKLIQNPNIYLLNQPNDLKLAFLFYKIFVRNPLIQNYIAQSNIIAPHAIIYAGPFHIFLIH